MIHGSRASGAARPLSWSPPGPCLVCRSELAIHAPGGDAARAAVAGVAATLAAFEDAALRAETFEPAPATGLARPGLRAVDAP